MSKRSNGGRLCDTNNGPCNCGAWHHPDEPEVRKNPNVTKTGEILFTKREEEEPS